MSEAHHSDEEQFTSGDSGASKTYPIQCSALRKNGHVNIKGKPCKIVEMTTSKTGKHGHAKVHLTGLDIFTGKKLEDICPSTHNVDVPNVKRQEYVVIDIDDEGFCTLMDDQGETRDDLQIKDNCNQGADEAKKMWNDIDADSQQLAATVIEAMDQCIIKDVKIKGLTS